MNLEIQQRIQTLLQSKQLQILGIVGAPGSGKSTLTNQIAQKFGAAVAVLPMDGFHLANVELARLGRAARKGAPDTFDVAGYVALLERVRQASSTVYAPRFEREIEEAIASSIAILPEIQLIITEGNYLLLEDGGWQSVRPLLDECWYVAVDDELRRERLLARHVQFGRTVEDAQAWIENTDEPNARRIAATQARADWVIA